MDLPQIRVGGVGPDIAPDLMQRLIDIGRPLESQLHKEMVRQVGETLSDVGGFNLMQTFAYAYRARTSLIRTRELEIAWDGIGEWAG